MGLGGGRRGGGDEMTFGLVLGVTFKPEISTKFLKRTFAQNHHLFQYFLKYLPYHGLGRYKSYTT